MRIIQMLCVMLLFSACTYTNNKAETAKYSKQLFKDNFTYKNTYAWSFKLMGTTQVSSHTFFADSIVYSMKGKVYATDYTMKKLSYEKQKNKWIGEDEKGVVYVLFFKHLTDSTLTIYKHKCKENGLKEAIDFKKPLANATEDHGWNVYSLYTDNQRDKLAVSGSYFNKENKLTITDSVIYVNEKKATKISFHSGERRWVGKCNEQYVQLFFNTNHTKDTIKVSVNWFKNQEKMYKTTYKTATNWANYKNK